MRIESIKSQKNLIKFRYSYIIGFIDRTYKKVGFIPTFLYFISIIKFFQHLFFTCNSDFGINLSCSNGSMT